jgi:Na+/H+ antiporter NhaD/arsenite permease-like protein
MIWITAVIFSLTYLGLALGRVPGLRMDRAAIAFVGAALMLVTGVLTIPQAVAPESIDFETLFLLFGMMVVVGCLRLSGVFARLTNWSLGRIRTPRAMLAITILLAGVLSAFLVNDIVCLAIAPLVIHLARRLRFDPLPHLIGVATAANIGSAGTITGNPQNMIIGIQSRIPYLTFAAHLMPLAAIGLALDFLIVAWVYRDTLATVTNDDARVLDDDSSPNDPAPHAAASSSRARLSRDRKTVVWLQRKSIAVTIVTVAMFFAGFQIALVAIAAAAVMLIGPIKSRRIYDQIDWSLLVMFIGLFIVVHAFGDRVVATWRIDQWTGLLAHPVSELSVAAAVLSNLVSNVPAVLLFEPIMRAIPDAARQNAWLALAMSSTFAGNLTVLGSVANLIVVENARREGVAISFTEYSKVGIPVTIATLALGIAWLELVAF